MGATTVSAVVSASSAEEALKMLQEEDRERYGSDSYNGSFTTINYLSKNRKYSYKFSDKPYKEKNKEIVFKDRELYDDIDKYCCEYIDLGVENYVAEKVTVEKPKDDLKLEYILENVKSGRTYVTNAKSLKEAKDCLIRKADDYDIIRKAYVDKYGQEAILKKKIVSKTYKTKPKKVPAGYKLKVCNKYYIFGWAAC